MKHKIEALCAEVHHMSPLPSHVGSALSYYQADNWRSEGWNEVK
jgi:hypothetical protein